MTRDVIVTITEDQKVTSLISFGKVLLISTEKAHEYKEYDLNLEIETIKTTFGSESLTYKKALRFSQLSQILGGANKLAIFGVDSTATDFGVAELSETLEQLILNHGDYFRVIVATDDDKYKFEIAKWANNYEKFARIQYDNTELIEDYSELGQRILLYTKDDYLDVAECVFASSKIPGSFNYKFKNLGTIFPADSLNSLQIAAAENKKMGYYINHAGISMIRNGYASNGKFIDDLESRVYVKTLIQTKVMQLLVSEKKVSGGPIGLKQIVSMTMEALEECTSQGIIMKDANGQGDYAVNTDNASFDKKEGKWKNIKFRYKYNDSTNGVIINGVVE